MWTVTPFTNRHTQLILPSSWGESGFIPFPRPGRHGASEQRNALKRERYAVRPPPARGGGSGWGSDWSRSSQGVEVPGTVPFLVHTPEAGHRCENTSQRRVSLESNVRKLLFLDEEALCGPETTRGNEAPST